MVRTSWTRWFPNTLLTRASMKRSKDTLMHHLVHWSKTPRNWCGWIQWRNFTILYSTRNPQGYIKQKIPELFKIVDQMESSSSERKTGRSGTKAQEAALIIESNGLQKQKKIHKVCNFYFNWNNTIFIHFKVTFSRILILVTRNWIFLNERCR